MKIFGLIVTFIAIALADLPGLVKAKKRTKTMIVYFSLIALVFTLSYLYSINKAPASPAAMIEKIIRAILPGKYTVQ